MQSFDPAQIEQNLRTSCERPVAFSENEIKQLMK